MISEELKVIVGEFKEQGKMNFLVETTEDKISEFEKEHTGSLTVLAWHSCPVGSSLLMQRQTMDLQPRLFQ